MAAEEGGELAGVVLEVAEGVEVVLGACEGEVREAGWAAKCGFGFGEEGGGDEFAAAEDVGEEFVAGEHAAGELFVKLGAAERVHAVGALVGLPGIVVRRGVDIDEARDVVCDLPEGVDADRALPVLVGALGDGLVEHGECGVELGDEEGGEHLGGQWAVGSRQWGVGSGGELRMHSMCEMRCAGAAGWCFWYGVGDAAMLCALSVRVACAAGS